MREKYWELRENPPTLDIKKGAYEVEFKTVSVMCDNVNYLTFKRDKALNEDFRMSGNGFALSNWQFKYTDSDIKWAADNEDWYEVIRMINTGTAAIVKSR